MALTKVKDGMLENPGGGPSNVITDNFVGDGVQTDFILTEDPGSKSNLFVFLQGVEQEQSTFDVTGTTLSFVTAPPNTVTIEVKYGVSLDIGTPSDDTVSTIKIQDGAVTKSKLAPLGQQLSLSSGSFTTTSLSETDVTNLTVTITTTGRPVWVGLVADTSDNNFKIVSLNFNSEGADATLFIKRGSNYIFRSLLQFFMDNTGANNCAINYPIGGFQTVDPVGAGTYTYTVSVMSDGIANIDVQNCRLLAFEL